MCEIYIGNPYKKNKNIKRKYGIVFYDDNMNLLFLLYKNFFVYPTFNQAHFQDKIEAFSQYFDIDPDKLVELMTVRRETTTGLLETQYFCYNSNNIRSLVLNNIYNYDLVNLKMVIYSGDSSLSNMERVAVAKQLQKKMEYKVY